MRRGWGWMPIEDRLILLQPCCDHVFMMFAKQGSLVFFLLANTLALFSPTNCVHVCATVWPRSNKEKQDFWTKHPAKIWVFVENKSNFGQRGLFKTKPTVTSIGRKSSKKRTSDIIAASLKVPHQIVTANIYKPRILPIDISQASVKSLVKFSPVLQAYRSPKIWSVPPLAGVWLG